jgi:GT2 family glycosyltransferase
MSQKVTIVMTVRENYSLTIQSIDSIIKHTTAPHRFIFVNYKTPESILEEITKRGVVEIFNSNSPYPSVSMKSVVSEIATPYTVYLDNNITVSPLWLENLIVCMELNKAGVVGPAYLWNKDKIHMFGGNITIKGKHFTERHHMINYPAHTLKTLKTRRCDYVEYHCLMVRTDLLKQGALDDSLMILHQHIDLSLMTKRMGYGTFVTPHSVVTYENQAEIQDYEHDLFRERWDADVGEKDIAYFCNKWNFANDSGFDDVRNFLRRHNAKR